MAGLFTSPANMPAVATPIQATGSVIPNRLYVRTPGFKRAQTRILAGEATKFARTLSPKLSGRAAEGIKPYYGDGFFGLTWDRPHLWYQNAGINPFTMNNLAGKTIPMWVDDPTGDVKRKNPKADTRITTTGRRQVKIFRKVGKHGARKKVADRDRQGRIMKWRDVPQSYPGAPGRIQYREWRQKGGTTGRIDRVISRPNVGVRWRHPGLVPREFLQHAIQRIGVEAGVEDLTIYATYGKT